MVKEKLLLEMVVVIQEFLKMGSRQELVVINFQGMIRIVSSILVTFLMESLINKAC